MARKKLTDKGIERLNPPASGRVERWDSECPGFGIRITETGVNTFQVMYRFGGTLRRKALGRFTGEGAGGLAEARRRARKIIETAKGGVDPEVVEKQEAAKRARENANSFAAIRALFIEEWAKPRNRSWREAQRYLERDLDHWDERPLGSITRAEIKQAIKAKARDGGGYAANLLLANVRRLFNWAVDEELISASPAVRIAKPHEEKGRERALTVDEIKRLWSAWDEPTTKWPAPADRLGFPFGPMFRLLLVLGARRDEIAGALWSEIKPRPAQAGATAALTPIEWCLTISAERSKAKRECLIPLPPLAQRILGDLPRFKSDYLFPSRSSGERYASGFSKGKRRSDELSGVADWRLHDLRRTAATQMAELGVSNFDISRVLGHAEAGVTREHYNKYSYLPEKTRALEKWAQRIEIVTSPEPVRVADISEARARRSKARHKAAVAP